MPPPLPDRKVIEAWAGLLRLNKVLLERVEAALKADGQPPLSWYDVLIELDRAEGGRLRLFELAERMLLNKSNLTRLLDRLEGRGLLLRQPCPEDRRGAYAAITPRGRKLLGAMWPSYGGAIQRHFARHLGANELAAMQRAAARLLAANEDRA